MAVFRDTQIIMPGKMRISLLPIPVSVAKELASVSHLSPPPIPVSVVKGQRQRFRFFIWLLCYRIVVNSNVWEREHLMKDKSFHRMYFGSRRMPSTRPKVEAHHLALDVYHRSLESLFLHFERRDGKDGSWTDEACLPRAVASFGSIQHRSTVSDARPPINSTGSTISLKSSSRFKFWKNKVCEYIVNCGFSETNCFFLLGLCIACKIHFFG